MSNVFACNNVYMQKIMYYMQALLCGMNAMHLGHGDLSDDVPIFASLVLPRDAKNSDPWDRFVCPYLTLMSDSYIVVSSTSI